MPPSYDISVPLAALGITPAAPYLGPVATTGLVPDSINTGAQQLMSATYHWARDNLIAPQLVFPNFYVTGNPLAEAGSGSATTLEASIEYPIGTYTRVTFSGVNQGSIPNGGVLTSDACAIAIPSGALFRVRSYWINASGIIYCAYPNNGNLLSFGTTTPNYVMGGGQPAAQAAAGYGPVAIIQNTSRPSFALIGDSRQVGLGDTAPTQYHRGYCARAIGPNYAYINISKGADQTAWFNASSTNRRALAAYCSHVICQYGINGINGGGTAANEHAALQTLYGLSGIAGKPIWQTTLEPIGVTGTYTSEGGQTAGSTNAARVTFNDTLRAGIAGIQGVIDVTKVVESLTTTGVFQAPNANALTADGAHLNTRGNLMVVSAYIFPAGFTR